MRIRKAFLSCLCFCFLSACALFAETGPAIDESSWTCRIDEGEARALPGGFPLKVTVPPSASASFEASFSLPAGRSGPLGIALYKNNMAIKVYVNDVYVDSLGKAGPSFFFEPYISRGVLVSEALLKESNKLRLVAYGDSGSMKLRAIKLMGEDEYRDWCARSSLLDVQLPRFCCVLLLFVSLYSLFFFLNYRDKRESLFLGLSSAFFAAYLLNVSLSGSILPYVATKALLYSCFPVSMAFLFLFFRFFFKMRGGRRFYALVLASGAALALGYYFQRDSASLDLWHSLMLVYPMSAIAYGFVGAARRVRAGEREHLPILCGLALAVAFSAYDSYYFIGDKPPVILLQGIGFMCLIFGAFYAFSQDIANTNKKVAVYSAEMERSKAQRDDIFQRIRKDTTSSEGSARILAGSIERVDALASQYMASIDQINGSLDIEKEQIESSKASVERIFDAIGQTSGMVGRHGALVGATKGDMEDLTGKIHRTDELLKSSGKTISRLTEVCLAADREVKESSQAVDDLASYSKHIDEIVKSIGDLAAQTNVLSINAAIQAARSGAAGRGFAVVAGEVRSLAGKSGENANQIKEILSTMVAKIGRIQEREAAVSERLRQVVEENGAIERAIVEILEAIGGQLAKGDAIRAAVAELVETVGEIARQSSAQKASGDGLMKAMAALDETCAAILAASREQKSYNEDLGANLRQLRSVSAENTAVIADMKALVES
jgi:Methyl-accepting chemotaxis protein